jgi:hypothetical protein
VKRRLYEIQVRSIWQAIEHLRLIDLDELIVIAEEQGTDEEVRLIGSLRVMLPKLPPQPAKDGGHGGP